MKLSSDVYRSGSELIVKIDINKKELCDLVNKLTTKLVFNDGRSIDFMSEDGLIEIRLVE